MQTDVTEKVQAQFHCRLVTPLGDYDQLFDKEAPAGEKTLKVKLRYWRDGVVKTIELPQDSPLDLTRIGSSLRADRVQETPHPFP